MATQFQVDIADEEQYTKEVLKGSTGNLHGMDLVTPVVDGHSAGNRP